MTAITDAAEKYYPAMFGSVPTGQRLAFEEGAKWAEKEARNKIADEVEKWLSPDGPAADVFEDADLVKFIREGA